MKFYFRPCRSSAFALCGAVLLALPLPLSQPHEAVPIRLIYDTDMMTDGDDAAALAMIHTMADEGEEILATMVCT